MAIHSGGEKSTDALFEEAKLGGGYQLCGGRTRLAVVWFDSGG